VKPQHDNSAVELRFDLIFNIAGADQDPTEIAGKSGAFSTPHAYGNGTAQCGHVQP
jgi:hypothetical protein